MWGNYILLSKQLCSYIKDSLEKEKGFFVLKSKHYQGFHKACLKDLVIFAVPWLPSVLHPYYGNILVNCKWQLQMWLYQETRYLIDLTNIIMVMIYFSITMMVEISFLRFYLLSTYIKAITVFITYYRLVYLTAWKFGKKTKMSCGQWKRNANNTVKNTRI